MNHGSRAAGHAEPQTEGGLFAAVRRQFDKAADLMGLDPDIRKILATTTNEVTVHFPVRMDDGQIDIFSGYRVQHNDVL
ncbi:MAG: Glu/Leu/Phe/Val dehydrogenase dimerization domain-containing protein, partial [Gemmatimonadota bacterium]